MVSYVGKLCSGKEDLQFHYTPKPRSFPPRRVFLSNFSFFLDFRALYVMHTRNFGSRSKEFKCVGGFLLFANSSRFYCSTGNCGSAVQRNIIFLPLSVRLTVSRDFLSDNFRWMASNLPWLFVRQGSGHISVRGASPAVKKNKFQKFSSYCFRWPPISQHLCIHCLTAIKNLLSPLNGGASEFSWLAQMQMCAQMFIMVQE